MDDNINVNAESADRSTDRAADRSTDQAADRSTDQATDRSTDQATDQSVEATQPAESHPQSQDDPPEPIPHQENERTPFTWLEREEIDNMRSKWASIQTQFVDQPRAAVEQAETLIADAVERITRMLADHQTKLSEQWCDRDDASTEDLRLTMRDYRSFLDRLLEH